jgi:branched-chain amino acid aminotransferase
MPSSLACVNGKVTAAEEATVSVLDNGFAFGDAVYETLRTYGGRPFHLDRHLARLRASAARLGFDVGPEEDGLRRPLDDLLARAGNAESYIRFIVSRGRGDLSYDFGRVQGPTLVLVVRPLVPMPAAFYEEGVLLAVASVRRNHPDALDPAIKSCNLLNNLLATREARARGAFEAVLLNAAGDVAEGAGSNVFAVKAGVARTPPLSAGILAGITRQVVLELAPAAGVTVREEALRPADLREADEVFLTSTLKECLPARTIDGVPVGTGRPGPVTRRLLDAYRRYAPAHSV